MNTRALRILLLVVLASLFGGCAAFRQPELVFICGTGLLIIEEEEEPCTGTRDKVLDAAAMPPDGD